MFQGLTARGENATQRAVPRARGRNGIRRSPVCELSRCSRLSLRIATPGVRPAPRRLRPHPPPCRAFASSAQVPRVQAARVPLRRAVGGCVGHSGLLQSRTRSACPHNRVSHSPSCVPLPPSSHPSRPVASRRVASLRCTGCMRASCVRECVNCLAGHVVRTHACVSVTFAPW